MDTEILKTCGIDYEKGVARFMGDAKLYDMLIGEYLKDASCGQMEEALARRDYPDMFVAAHTLKGVAGNMDMRELYAEACELTELLRGREHPDEAAVAASAASVSRLDGELRAGIKKALDS